MVRGKLCLPGDDAVRLGTIDIPDTEDPEYPHSYLALDDPSYVVKSTNNLLTVQVQLPSAMTVVAASVHTTNAETSSVQSDEGLDEPLVIPALGADGQRRGGWVNLAGVDDNDSDLWTFQFARASGIVWVGRVSLWLAARDVNWEAGRNEGVLRPGNIAITTRLGSVLHDDQGIATRWYDMTFTLAEDAALFRALDASAKGAILPFALVPDETVNDALWVNCPEPFSLRLSEPGFASMPRRFLELSQGPPNG